MILQALSIFSIIQGSNIEEEEKCDIEKQENILSKTMELGDTPRAFFPYEPGKKHKEATSEDILDMDNIGMNQTQERSKDLILELANTRSEVVNEIRDSNISITKLKLDENYSDKLNATSVFDSMMALINQKENKYNRIIETLFMKFNSFVLPDELSPCAAILNSSMGSLVEFNNILKDMESKDLVDIFNQSELQGRLKFLFSILKAFIETTRTIDSEGYLAEIEDVFKLLLSDLIEKVDELIENLETSNGINDYELEKRLKSYDDNISSIRNGSFDSKRFTAFISNLANIIKIISKQVNSNHTVIQDLIIILLNYSELLSRTAMIISKAKNSNLQYESSIQSVDKIIVFFIKYVFGRPDFSDSFDLIFKKCLSTSNFNFIFSNSNGFKDPDALFAGLYEGNIQPYLFIRFVSSKFPNCSFVLNGSAIGCNDIDFDGFLPIKSNDYIAAFKKGKKSTIITDETWNHINKFRNLETLEDEINLNEYFTDKQLTDMMNLLSFKPINDVDYISDDSSALRSYIRNHIHVRSHSAPADNRSNYQAFSDTEAVKHSVLSPSLKSGSLGYSISNRYYSASFSGTKFKRIGSNDGSSVYNIPNSIRDINSENISVSKSQDLVNEAPMVSGCNFDLQKIKENKLPHLKSDRSTRFLGGNSNSSNMQLWEDNVYHENDEISETILKSDPILASGYRRVNGLEEIIEYPLNSRRQPYAQLNNRVRSVDPQKIKDTQKFASQNQKIPAKRTGRDNRITYDSNKHEDPQDFDQFGKKLIQEKHSNNTSDSPAKLSALNDFGKDGYDLNNKEDTHLTTPTNDDNILNESTIIHSHCNSQEALLNNESFDSCNNVAQNDPQTIDYISRSLNSALVPEDDTDNEYTEFGLFFTSVSMFIFIAVAHLVVINILA